MYIRTLISPCLTVVNDFKLGRVYSHLIDLHTLWPVRWREENVN